MHETEKVTTVNAQRSNRQICCSRRHPLERTETEISKKNKLPFFRQNKAENLNLNKRN